MTGLSTNSKTIKVTAPGGAITKVVYGLESLFMFQSSDCPKGKLELNHQPERNQVGGLDRDSATIHSVGRYSLTIGKTVAHRGVGRSAPIPFFDLVGTRTEARSRGALIGSVGFL